MTKSDEAVAAAVCEQIRHEAMKLGAWDFLILKSVLAGKIAYEEMPYRLREALLAIGRAAFTSA